jgi:hypothetical protein
MISSWDDFPVHQTPQPVRFVATSDRNFYDRYYFNLHASSDELFAVIGLGYGLYEHAFIGPFERYGMHDRADGAS